MVDYSSGKYLVRPLVKNVFGTFPASPVAEFSVPEPVSLETTTITVQKDKAQRVAINGGWGDYSVIVLDKSVCTAELKQEGDSYYIQIVGKKDGGSTSVTLKDLRSQKTAAVLVSVTNEVVQKLIKVEPTEIDFGVVPVGTSKTEHFTVSNVGTTSLTFRLSEHHSDIDIPESGKEFTLAAGESKTFDVIFTPSDPNGGSGSAVRVFSDAENGTQYVTIEGQGAPSSDIPSYTSCPDSHHPHLIDLGLPSGTKWACCNVGAEKPEDYGGYFAWGETAEKSSYTSDNYLDGKGTSYDIGKDISGTQYDAATVNWGSPWVMPSKEQMEELKNNCTSEWTTENGVNGRRFTGPNGASIFLPAAGDRWGDDLTIAGSNGYYWSSTLNESSTGNAYVLDFSSGYVYTDYYGRYHGPSVRPVRKN